MTPEDIAKGLPDDDAFGESSILELIKYDHKFKFDLLEGLFRRLKTEKDLYASVVMAYDERRFPGWSWDTDLIIVYKSETGPWSDVELMHELRLYYGN